MATRTRKKTTVTDEHKAAMAQGRTEARAVKTYLEALDNTGRRRGRPRTAENVQRRLSQIEDAIPGAPMVDKVALIQERMNLQAELDGFHYSDNLDEIEADFINVCKSYSERKGISYAAWREAGVPADVLRRAGLSRSYEGG